MKQFLISFLLLLGAGNISAQFFHSGDIVAGLGSSFRIIDGNGSMTELRRNELEIPKINGNIGFNFNIDISQKLFLKTGFRYLSLGYKTIGQELVLGDMSTTNIFFIYDYYFMFQEGEAKISTRSRIGSEFNKYHIALNAGIGLSYNLFASDTQIFLMAIYRHDFTSLVRDLDYTETLYSYGIEFGVRRSLSKKK